MIVYATGANDVASDGLGRNSPFTSAFLNHVGTPGLDIYNLYRNVAVDVHEATGGEQRPEQFGNVTVRYALVPGDTDSVTTMPPPEMAEPDAEADPGRERDREDRPASKPVEPPAQDIPDRIFGISGTGVTLQARRAVELYGLDGVQLETTMRLSDYP